MDQSFKVYVDIFGNEGEPGAVNIENSEEQRLGSYEVVTASDITGVDCMSGGEEAHDKPGRIQEKACENNQETSNKTKLCGYLKVHKPGDKMQKRRRWFVFSEEICRLLYFRTPQDMIPRCDIDIASASFNIQEPSGERNLLNKFEIRTKESTFILEAADQKTMLYWLQELQKHREHFNRTKQTRLPFRCNMVLEDSVDGEAELHSLQGANILVKNVSLPRDTVGQQTKDSSRTVGANFHLFNLKDELRKMVSGVWQQKNMKKSEDGEKVESPPIAQPTSPSSGFHLKRTLKSKSAEVRQKMMRHKSGSENTVIHTAPSVDSICHRCSAHEDSIVGMKEEMQSVEEELQATREVTWILQKQIDELMREKQLQHSLTECDFSADARAHILYDQEKKIVSLEYLLTATQEEKEILKATNKSLEAQVGGLRDQILAYRDSLQSKEDVLVHLTDELSKAETQLQFKSESTTTHSSPQQPGDRTERISPNSIGRQENREIQRLHDIVTAYKTQNQFLNKEIMDLNGMRQDDNSKMQKLVQTCLKLETCYYDEHRKHLACLKELGKGQSEDDPGSLQILENLLEDAVVSRNQWSGGNKTKTDVNETRYDENGFPVNQEPEYYGNSFTLDDKLSSEKKQSDVLFHKAKSIEEGLRTNLMWERFMASLGAGAPLQKSKELKELIRLGVPNSYRSTVWKWCVDFATKTIKAGFQDNYYENLISTLKNSQLLVSATARQVEMDLLRTLPGNKYFENMTSEKVQALRRILLAFSVHDPMVGYCQGLNRITGIALLFLEEEDAFWCLVTIVNSLLPQNYFCAGMQAAHTDQRVLFDIVQEKLPALCSHLKEIDVDLCVFTFNWFLTIYIDSIPSQMYLRIWDSFLYEGSKVLFRYAIAFLKYVEDDLLSIKESSQLHLYLRSLGHNLVDVNKVAKIAFHEINPFKMKHIEARRQHHCVIVKAELDRMEEQRESYRKKMSSPPTDLISFDDLAASSTGES